MQHLCRLDLENRDALASLRELPRAFRSFARPAEVGIDWHQTENQGRLGSCQGQGLTSVMERVQFVRWRDKLKVVQLSRIFAYLAVQQMDGLLGADNGSTIGNGARLAHQRGVPPESLAGYPSAYPGQADRNRILSAANFAAGEPFKVESLWQVPQDPEEACNFIGGGGGISFGIIWYDGLIPADRIVRQYRAGSRGGGHAMAVLGYTRTGNLRAVNSWGDGPYEIMPDAWRAMMRHPWTAAYGLVGTEDAGPVNWVEDSYIRSGLYS